MPQAGYKSLLAPWLGGGSAPAQMPPGGGGYRSMLAFWMGGVTSDTGTPPTPIPDVILLGGGPGYERYHRHKSYQELREESEHATRQDELKRIEEKIAQAEKRRLAAYQRANARLAAKNTALKQLALEQKLQEEINGLRIERVRLMRLIDDEEVALVLLLSSPFN